MHLRRLWLVFGVCVLGASAVSAQTLNGRIRETFQRIDTDGVVLGNVLQDYQIGFRNHVTQTVWWEARFHALIDGFDQSGAPPTDMQTFEPFFQIVYEGSSWQLSGGMRATETGPKGGISTVPNQQRRDSFGRAQWSVEGLPTVNWLVTDTSVTKEDVRLSNESRSLLTASQGLRSSHWGLSLENRWFEDPNIDFRRDSYEITGNGDTHRSFLAGRLSFSAQGTAAQGRIVDRTSGTVTVDVQRRPRAGLFAIDPTPDVGQLPDAPALVDGDLTAGAADLDADFRNFGFDFGFPQKVDSIFVYVERTLLPGHEQDYFWEVYTSTDGIFWAIHSGAQLGVFNTVRNRFEIRFPLVPANVRYVKIVNLSHSVNEPPLAVTEIEAFGQELRTGQDVTRTEQQSGNLSVLYKASPHVDVTFNSFGNRQGIEEDGLRPARNSDLNNTLATTLRRGVTMTTVSLQAIERDSTDVTAESDRIVAATFAATPVSSLDLSISGQHRRNTSEGDLLARQDLVSVRAAARFLHNTEASVDLSYFRQDAPQVNLDTVRRSANFTLASTLRPSLVFTGNYLIDRQELSGVFSGAPGRTDLYLASRLTWRPTRVFGGGIGYLYQRIGERTGETQMYDVDWLPFPGGSLQVELSKHQDRQSLQGGLRDQNRAAVRWNMNPRTQIELSYSIIRQGIQPQIQRQEISTIFLEWRL
ncbi:MAG: discoidin domain-containing protein [Acidobacteria bacterium]|nr:discoidin domain-containing protein [Acidobacteriota bacterium]